MTNLFQVYITLSVIFGLSYLFVSCFMLLFRFTVDNVADVNGYGFLRILQGTCVVMFCWGYLIPAVLFRTIEILPQLQRLSAALDEEDLERGFE